MTEPSSSIPVPIEGLSLADIEQIVLATESHSDEIWTRRVAVALKSHVDTALSRLTRERDDERSNHRRTVEAMEFEQRDIESRATALAAEIGCQAMSTTGDAQVERLTKERDDIHALWLKCCSNSVALVHQHDELKAQIARWEGIANSLGEQVKRLLAKEGERIGKVLVQFDFEQHLARQRAWSEQTFGPGERAKGVSDHIRKELDEIAAKPDDLEEWIDIVILALDGAWRAGNEPHQIIAALVAKQAKNEARQWPDWRTVEPGKAVEHVRTLNERLDEPLPELRRDANGNPIPWAKEHDYFMAFDPNDPDTPTD